MKKLKLDHSFTPPPLLSINRDLSELTTEKDPDESIFLKLVIERDEFIQKFLENIPNEEKKIFVTGIILA